jgi:hypothetical protein
LDRVRKLYKRFFPVSWTFSITRFSTFFRKTEFFNSHPCYQQLSGKARFAQILSGYFRVARHSGNHRISVVSLALGCSHDKVLESSRLQFLIPYRQLFRDPILSE